MISASDRIVESVIKNVINSKMWNIAEIDKKIISKVGLIIVVS
jgi:hypothetical protein